MDDARFDSLVRTLSTVGSRRQAVVAAFGGALGWLGAGSAGVEAHNALLKCKKLKGEKKKKCLKKAKKHNSKHTTPPPPAPPGCGTGGPCLVFVTSTAHPGGTLGGLVGADAICQQKAQAASLPGTYLAWLADSANSPATRFMQSTGPYRRVDGVTVADTWTDLTDGSLDAAINLSETGAAAASGSVWTHVLANGTAEADADHCGDWSTVGNPGDFGDLTATDGRWTDTASGGACHNFVEARLYCFQQS